MSEYYSPDNLKAILPYLTKTPQWLILGGPGDAREAQTARELWPTVRIIGIEPNVEAVAWQAAHGWPWGCPLLNCALADKDGETDMVFETGRLRNASIDPEAVEGNRGEERCTFQTVATITLDALEQKYGPFEDAIVWMDIEGSELRALQGAPNLIASGRVLLWNIEMLSRVPGMMEGVPKLLSGYKAVKDWNDSATCRDRIFVRG